jgi:hypothetical protein
MNTKPGEGLRRVVAVGLALAAAGSQAFAQDFEFKSPPPEDSVAALNAPLFSSHETLHLRIEAPIRALKGDRDQEEDERPGRVDVLAPESLVTSLPVDIRTRGFFRLRRSTCEFPPLRLDFPKDSTVNTVFEGENRLKLVTHCRDADRFEQFALQEYVIYRIYNLLTEQSFRVRLASIRYVDSERGDSLTRYAVLLEAEDRMAARNGMIPFEFEHEGAGASARDPAALTRLALFQYMIGNTDWAAGEVLHNIKVMVDERQMPVAVPYDFDWSGVISAPYARPDPKLGTRHVSERVFFLGCLSMEQLTPYFEVFNDIRAAVESLVRDQEGLDPKTAKQMLEYLGEFYDIINDPRRASRELIRRC